MYPREKILFEAILLALALMLAIIMAFTLAAIISRRKFRRLNNKTISDLVHKLEMERKRVAEDIHDDIGPILSSAKFQLESLDSFSPEDNRVIKNSINLVDDVIVRIRHVSNGLVVTTLVKKGLKAAMDEFFTGTQIASLVHINADIDLPVLFPLTEAVHIFRIIQEITHNTIKHAGARSLEIKIYKEKNSLFILTADDGRGFDTTPGEDNAGLGLSTIKNRVSLLRGELSIKSVYKKGTMYHIELPLP